MRILLISDHADPLVEIGSKEAGGQNVYVYYLARFLSRKGVFLDIYTRWDKKSKKEVERINKYVRVIRVKAGPRTYIPRDTFLNVIDEFAANILKRIEKDKIYYDIIHSNYWFSGIIALEIAKIINLPIVHINHSLGLVRFNALKRYGILRNDYKLALKRVRAERNIAQVSTGLIATSPIEKEIIIKNFKVNPQKIECIPIGIDTKIFKPAQIKKSCKKDAEKMILYVGRIERRKGIGTLLYALHEVLKKFPASKLLIIGGGRTAPEKKLESGEIEHLSSIIKKLRIEKSVLFLGPKQQKDLGEYYNDADLVVVPSYYEPFGIVPVESMACGTPVVASRTGGLKYTVKNGLTGHLAKPRNYRDLAKKITLTLKNGKNHYRNNCIRRVKKCFTWEGIAEAYYKYLNRIIKNKVYAEKKVAHSGHCVKCD